jgi:hypothetical protein
MATNGNLNHADQYAAPAQTTDVPANADGSTPTVPKDEVAWYFVEQYYTTMSKSPERLHVSDPPLVIPLWRPIDKSTALLWQKVSVRLRPRGRGRQRLVRPPREYPDCLLAMETA